MLLFNGIKRGFLSVPRLLPLASPLIRFKIWETEKIKKNSSVDNKIYSVSIETGRIYASLDQDKVDLLKKDKEFEFGFFKTNPLDAELKNYIINEHILNGDPNHIITLKGLKSEYIQNALNQFLSRGHYYGSAMWVGGINGFMVNNEKDISQLLTNLLVGSGVESILGQSILDNSEYGLINTLIEAEKIERNQEDDMLGYRVK